MIAPDLNQAAHHAGLLAGAAVDGQGCATMRAADLMSGDVLSFGPDDPVRHIATQLVAQRVSGAPVVDGDGRVIGMISEGDLLRRAELGTDLRRGGWLGTPADARAAVRDFTRTHGRRARDIMSGPVISVSETTPIAAIARLMEDHKVKRLPVVRGGRLVGIVSRADVIGCLAADATASQPPAADREAANAAVRARVMHALLKAPWPAPPLLNVAVVDDGIVEIAGTVATPAEKRAVAILIEEVPGVTALRDMIVLADNRLEP
jgi:CBS-domain-containing membrane protein